MAQIRVCLTMQMTLWADIFRHVIKIWRLPVVTNKESIVFWWTREEQTMRGASQHTRHNTIEICNTRLTNHRALVWFQSLNINPNSLSDVPMWNTELLGLRICGRAKTGWSRLDFQIVHFVENRQLHCNQFHSLFNNNSKKIISMAGQFAVYGLSRVSYWPSLYNSRQYARAIMHVGWFTCHAGSIIQWTSFRGIDFSWC